MRQTFKKQKFAIITEFPTSKALAKIMVLPEDSTSVVEFFGVPAARLQLPQLWFASGLNQSLV